MTDGMIVSLAANATFGGSGSFRADDTKPPEHLSRWWYQVRYNKPADASLSTRLDRG
jgi:hypothetical protein